MSIRTIAINLNLIKQIIQDNDVQEISWEPNGSKYTLKSLEIDGEQIWVPCYKGHKYSGVITSPTCTERGYITQVCNNCGDSFIQTTIDALGHDFGEWIEDIKPTTVSEGLEHRKCSICGDTEERTKDKLPPLNYVLSRDESHYTIAATDTYISGDITIPSEYKGKPVTAIDVSAFQGCSDITSVVIPNSVTYIGQFAFEGCDSLTSVAIPDSVTSIGSEAFAACSSLTSVVIGNSVTDIDVGVFSGCESLASVVIPDSVISIGRYAFQSCYNLNSVVIGNSVTTISEHAFSYCSRLASVTIPDSVTIIGDSAFRNCDSLTSVVIGNSVTYIDNYAFYNCSGLTSVVIGDNVTSIGGSAFYSCSSLTSVVIPNSVTSISAGAFFNCSGLTSVVIGDSVIYIDSWAFRGCSSLSEVYYNGTVGDWGEIDIGSDNTPLTDATRYYYSEEHPTTTGNFWHRVEGEIVVWCNTIVIDEAVDATCTETGLTEGSHCSVCGKVFVAQKVIAALGHDMGAWEIVTPPTTKSEGLERKKCSRCDYTEEREIDKLPPLSYTLSDDGSYYIIGATDPYISGDITIPSEYEGIPVTYISDHTFQGCHGLTSVIIPDTITYIGAGAFGGCNNLTSVTMGNSVKTICGDAFFNCSSLTSITIPDSVTSIGYEAFFGCSKLTEIVIGDGVASIDEDAFSDCYGLTDVYITDLSNWCSISFSNSYSNPLGYTDNLYVNGELVTELVIPDDVTIIKSYAFYSFDGITSVVIPDSVTSIGEGAFQSCYDLNSVVIPDSVTSIGGAAFSGCNSLTSVTIPDSVTSIGDMAFYGCDSLTSVYINDLSNWCSISFSDSYSNPLGYTDNLYVNGELVTELVIPDDVTIIKSYAFNNLDGITSVVIPDSVTTIGTSAFSSCSSLTSVVIGDSVTSIGNHAFYSCDSLVSVVIPKDLRTIDRNAFYGCSSLSKVYYDGTEKEWFWSGPTIGDSQLLASDPTFYYYSENYPNKEGNFWHWVNGKPTVWCHHTIVIDTAIGATCTESGLTEGKHCSVCGEVLVAQEVIDAYGHDIGPWEIVTPATCNRLGTRRRQCVRCGETETEAIPFASHKLSGWQQIQDEWRRTCTYTGCDYYVVSEGNEHYLTFNLLTDGTYEVSLTKGVLEPHIIDIPSIYKGIPVTKIADGGFREQLYIHEVILPEGIVHIGAGAFFGCRMLGYDLVIPSTVELIESNAFAQCDGIRTITFNSGSANTYIENGAFADCHGLQELNISSSVTHIEDGAFERCYGIESISVEEGNPKYHSQDNCLIETATNTVILGCENSVIPESVTTINSGAFCLQAPITIPLSVITVNSLAFSECEDTVVYVEAPSKPEGWADDWCDDSVTVVWGYVDTDTYLVTESGDFLTDEQGNLLIEGIYSFSLTYGTDILTVGLYTNTISATKTKTISVTPKVGYVPAAVVTNAEYTLVKNDFNYTLTVFNPTGDVTVTLRARENGTSTQ